MPLAIDSDQNTMRVPCFRYEYSGLKVNRLWKQVLNNPKLEQHFQIIHVRETVYGYYSYGTRTKLSTVLTSAFSAGIMENGGFISIFCLAPCHVRQCLQV